MAGRVNIIVATSAAGLSDTLVRLHRGLTDVEKPMRRVGVYMISSIHKNFDAQGRPVKWAGLSPMTKSLRRSGVGPGGMLILQDTGALRNSITYTLEGRDSLRVGTNLEYAKKLHFGGVNVMSAHTERVKSHSRTYKTGTSKVKSFSRRVPRREYKVPARPFILIQDSDVPVIEKIFIDHIRESIE